MFKDFIETKLRFKLSRVDPNMYYRRNVRGDGQAYYKLLLVYVDDVLAISHNPESIIIYGDHIRKAIVLDIALGTG